MPASGLLAGLGTLFSGTAGATILGSVVAGIGSSMAERSAERREERRRIEEEKRREARYAGAGDASMINPDDPEAQDPTTATSLTQQRVKAQKDPTTPLGFQETTRQIGQQSSQRFSYDPKQSKVVYT